MSSERPANIPEPLMDLIVLRSTCGLSDSEQLELNLAIEQSPFPQLIRAEIDRIELAIAATRLTDPLLYSNTAEDSVDDTSGPQDADDMLPSKLRDRILLDAGTFFADSQHEPTAHFSHTDNVVKSPVDVQASDVLPTSVSKTPRSSWREAAAMLVAAAAILLMVSGFNPFAKPIDNTVVVTQDPDGGSDSEKDLSPTLLEQFEAFVSSAPADLIRIPWTSLHDDDAAGEVLWSDELQQGFMCFTGLDANDAAVLQYQLWIFDTDREQKFPVDGGVFDIVSDTSQSVIPINAKIPVKKAVQFAVTEEEPGGVVVSARENIPVLASVAL